MSSRKPAPTGPRLRVVIEPEAARPRFVTTEPGVGYRLRVD